HRGYGTVGRGIWRSRYSIDWRNHVNENPELAKAEEFLRNHWSTNYLLQKSLALDRLTLQPFLWLDKFIVNPGLQLARTTMTGLSDSTTKLGYMLSTDSYVAWFTKMPQQTFDYRIVVDETKININKAATGPNFGTRAGTMPITGWLRSAEGSAEGSLIDSPRDIFHVLSRAKWRLNYSLQSLRRYGRARQFLAIYRELHPQNRRLSLPALVNFVESSFMPYVLWQSNMCNAAPGGDGGSQHWLKVHAAPHVCSLLTSLKTAPVELYGPGVVDDMTYDPKLQGLEYHGCFVKDPQLTRHDGSLDRDSLKRQVYRQAQQDTTEGDYNIDYSLLPSVIL
ncbi:hypothetical protein GNI_024920, partial [Gregarina niphandrodes]